MSRKRGVVDIRRSLASPVIHGIPTLRAISGARFALFLTLAAWVAYCVTQLQAYLSQPADLQRALETGAYLGLVTLLTASASAYLLCRLGYLARMRTYRRTPRVVVDAFFDETKPDLTIIVPSYREEPRVVRQTLLSAALQEYQDLRVVLLVDDPPNPQGEDAERLNRTRGLAADLTTLLVEPFTRFQTALEEFESSSDGATASSECLLQAAATYDEAVAWLTNMSDAEELVDHTDVFLVEDVIMRLARDLESVAAALRDAESAGAEISTVRIRQLYRRLTWIFGATLSSFERKQYASLSHEPNKATNLNSYLGLMGGRYITAQTPGGTVLLRADADEPHLLEVPDPDYVLTLDADSMLLPEYCLRLVAYMERPENQKIAVAQTPYSAYRGAPTRIERLAGATTDLQHMIHQGLTHYGATFWVGANAVLRKKALDAIMVEEAYKGFTIKSYIRDRTVVEDTESSIDLRLGGWQLQNIPERLSYSATPPDLGSLCVQRERWANGGLVILPKLIRLAIFPGAAGRRHLAELFLRFNYLASIAWASLGLSILLFYPFDQRLLSSLAVFTALPYFAAITTDLHRAGYRRTDVIWLYGFNMILLPINLVGTVKSIIQAIGGHKVAFARTPKVRARTVTPLAFVLVPFVIVAWSSLTLLYDILDHRYFHAAFAGLNVICTFGAMLLLHGIRNSIVDVAVNVREWVMPVSVPVAKPVAEEDWVTVLYYGSVASGESKEAAAVAGALAAIDDGRANLDPAATAVFPRLTVIPGLDDPGTAASAGAADEDRPDVDDQDPDEADRGSWRSLVGGR